MSEKPPYLDEQWDDLPLPDGDAAWQKMEALLDGEERKRRAVPWWFWPKAVAVVAMVLSAAGFWVWSVTEKQPAPTETVAATEAHPPATGNNRQPPNERIPPSTRDALPLPPANGVTETVTNGAKATAGPPSVTAKKAEGTTSTSKVRSMRKPEATAYRPSGQKGVEKGRKRHAGSKREPSSSVALYNVPGLEKSRAVRKKAKDSLLVVAEKGSGPLEKESAEAVQGRKESKRDTAKALPVPPVVQRSEASKKERPAIVWSAGIGLQRAIALSGQGSSPYNYAGKRSGLSDNIPSVYVRMQKGKWFLQGEFHYAVPQPVENIAFNQKTRYDAAAQSLNTERFTVEKLYYHQLPLSINYEVLPKFSFGVGGTYNVLAGAVTEQEVTSKNMQSNNESITRNVAPVKGFRDSFLYKTTVGILLQSDYHWKRISFGLRYTQSLQPFIKYTKPDGTVSNKRNGVLQAILRFRLWEGK